jgi:hypothetical protein
MALYRGFDNERIASGRHDVAPNSPEAETFVREATIGDGWLHPRSSNYTFVVELELGDKQGFGVYNSRTDRRGGCWFAAAFRAHR